MTNQQPIINLLNTISTNINTTIIKKKQPILLAVSGGQDSICLFFILIQLKKQWDWAFGILYCNHLWQKKSFWTGSLIIKISYLFNISTYYVTTSNKIFTEKSSRDWRYRTFYRICFFYNYKTILTGHTLSDKIETILFQFIRGTSPENLVSLSILKNFSTNKKFIKSSQIKHVTFYSKKNFNILTEPFQPRFFSQMLCSVKKLNGFSKKYNLKLDLLDGPYQVRNSKSFKSLNNFFHKNDCNKFWVPQKLKSSKLQIDQITALRMLVLHKSCKILVKNESIPCFSWFFTNRKKLTESVNFLHFVKNQRLYRDFVSASEGYFVRDRFATSGWRTLCANYEPSKYIGQKQRIFLCEQKSPCKICPVFHQNYKRVIKVNKTKINLKILKRVQKNHKQSIWLICQKIPNISFCKILNKFRINQITVSYQVFINTQNVQVPSTSTTRHVFTTTLSKYTRNMYLSASRIGLLCKFEKHKSVEVVFSSYCASNRLSPFCRKVHRTSTKYLCSDKNKTKLTKSILVRPILSLNRFDLKKLLLFFILPVYPDPTNQKIFYHRNQIRKELLPALKFFFNPRIELSFINFSEILSAEQFYLNTISQRLIREFYAPTKKNVPLNISFFFYIPIAFQRKLIKQLLIDCTNKSICFVNVERILNLLKKTTGCSLTSSIKNSFTK